MSQQSYEHDFIDSVRIEMCFYSLCGPTVLGDVGVEFGIYRFHWFTMPIDVMELHGLQGPNFGYNRETAVEFALMDM